MIEPKAKKQLILVAIACWLLAIPLQGSLNRYKIYRETSTKAITDVSEGGTLAMVAMLGGFRNITANILWLKSDEYWHQGGSGWWRMLPMLRTIVALDPHFIDAWDVLGWHCAWNLHSDAPESEKPLWIENGINYYRQGIRENPKRYELYSSLAWLYHDRLRDYNKAIPIWKKVCSFKDAPVTQKHMLAHCYERTWQVDKAVAVWKEALRDKKGDNPVAKSAIEWWAKHHDDRAYLISLWQRENRLRLGRGLPPVASPDGKIPAPVQEAK